MKEGLEKEVVEELNEEDEEEEEGYGVQLNIIAIHETFANIGGAAGAVYRNTIFSEMDRCLQVYIKIIY